MELPQALFGRSEENHDKVRWKLIHKFYNADGSDIFL
jgi:hypothetical protein